MPTTHQQNIVTEKLAAIKSAQTDNAKTDVLNEVYQEGVSQVRYEKSGLTYISKIFAYDRPAEIDTWLNTFTNRVHRVEGYNAFNERHVLITVSAFPA